MAFAEPNRDLEHPGFDSLKKQGFEIAADADEAYRSEKMSQMRRTWYAWLNWHGHSRP